MISKIPISSLRVKANTAIFTKLDHHMLRYVPYNTFMPIAKSYLAKYSNRTGIQQQETMDQNAFRLGQVYFSIIYF